MDVTDIVQINFLCCILNTEITAPTLWIKQLVYKENKQNSSNSRKSGENLSVCNMMF